MSRELSPEQAAAVAQGEDPTAGISDPAGEPAAASMPGEHAEPEATTSIFDALMNTEPSAALETIESPWDPDRGGPTRMYRGFQKLTNVDGMPAIADLLIGAVETFVQEVDAEDLQR